MGKILENGKAVVIPMDHGATDGIVPGLEDINRAVRYVDGTATAVILHKGMIKALDFVPKTGIIMHMSCGTAIGPKYVKTLISDVETALRLGADAVSVQANIGNSVETTMIEALGRVADACDKWGVPLLAMMYPRGEGVEVNAQTVGIAARVGAELGADIVKCPFCENFEEVVDACPVPVVIAGGSKGNDFEVLKMVEEAMHSGAAGISLGRNAFQHPRPDLMVKALRSIIVEGKCAKDAIRVVSNAIDVHK